MFKYEMHCHTAETSRCGRTHAADMVDFYKKAGYTGMVITDHFLNGNTTVPPFGLDWETRVKMFGEGYRQAKKRGDEVGLDVFFGWEFSYRGTDLLTYGLGEDWLLKNIHCDKLPMGEYCDLVHRDGGYVAHAHPFREDAYIDMIRLLPRKVDAVEIINACRPDFQNKLAEEYAKNYELTAICGSDNHTGPQPRLAALCLDFRAKSLDEIVSAIKENRHTIECKPLEEIISQ